MKTLTRIFVALLILAIFLVLSGGCKANNSIFAQNNPEQESVTATDPAPDQAVQETGNFFLDNWGVLLAGLLAFLEVIVRLTPTEKDNSLLTKLQLLLSVFLPNNRKGGGKFTPRTE